MFSEVSHAEQQERSHDHGRVCDWERRDSRKANEPLTAESVVLIEQHRNRSACLKSGRTFRSAVQAPSICIPSLIRWGRLR